MTLELDPLPSWADLSASEQRSKAKAFIQEIEDEASEQRRLSGQRVLGARAVRRQSRNAKVTPKPPPWYQERRRCICAWCDYRDPVVRQFVASYYERQARFRASSVAWRLEKPPDFPSGFWTPSRAIA
ncbi:MAG: hypothetical protein AAF654_08850 [Myxococcota bacterium]